MKAYSSQTRGNLYFVIFWYLKEYLNKVLLKLDERLKPFPTMIEGVEYGA